MRLWIQRLEITGNTVLFPHWDILTVQRLLEVKFWKVIVGQERGQPQFPLEE